MEIVGYCLPKALASILYEPEPDQPANVAIDRGAMPKAHCLAEIQPRDAGVPYNHVEHESIAQGDALLVDLAQPDQEFDRRITFIHRFTLQRLTHELCHAHQL